uniref:hypothetical protein n=1 Tax=Terasakiella sp. TaxID=2034861 RepID=UPI003AA8CE4C
KDYSSFINVAEMDTNGDGYKEIILRNIGMGRIYDTSPFQNIQIFTLEGGLDEFLAAQWKKVDGGRIINADTGMELINREINERRDHLVELQLHPNYDPNKRGLLANPYYSRTFGGGIQHPFSYQGEGYIAYIQPRTDFDQGKIDIAHWGLIQKITETWRKHDICYIAQLR